MRSFPFLPLAIFCVTVQAQGETKIKDGSGKDWFLDKKPKTVASSFLAGDEILIELVKNSKVKLVAISSVADDREYSNIVDFAKEVPNRIGANPESIAKIRPDLVFMASWNRPELSRTLSKLQIDTFTVSNFGSLEDIENNILVMGKVLDLEQRANQMVESMKQKMPKVANSNLSFITFDPSGVSLGQNTIFNSLLGRLGLVNVVKEAGWPKLSRESIARMQPDFVFTNGESIDQDPTYLLLNKTPGWKLLNAVKSKNIFLVPNRLLSCASQYVVSAYSHVDNLLKNRLGVKTSLKQDQAKGSKVEPVESSKELTK